LTPELGSNVKPFTVKITWHNQFFKNFQGKKKTLVQGMGLKSYSYKVLHSLKINPQPSTSLCGNPSILAWVAAGNMQVRAQNLLIFNQQ
jgi:hypothetical protein